MNFAQAKAAHLMQLYVWCHPKEKIKTVDGEISAFDWLEKEKNRIGEDPDRVAVIIQHGMMRSLFVDKVAEEEN